MSTKNTALYAAVIACGVAVHAGEITTNEAAWRELQAWRGTLEARKAGDVLAQLDAVMSGPAQWRAPVLSGEGWAYPWGYFALQTYAQACDELGQPVRAYRALANAFTYVPTAAPPAFAAGEFWRWHLAIGRQCAVLNRTFDAQWYLQQARRGLSTNDALYYEITAELAGVLSRLGDYEQAAALLDDVFTWRRAQPPRVWHDYIRLLFLCGRFEEGVAAIFAGARAHGFSARFLERDYFIADAARYWHFFRDADVLDWYELLGENLERLAPRRENEQLITLLINTRTLMKKAHPELLALPEDDLQALRERLAREQQTGHATRRRAAELAWEGAAAESALPAAAAARRGAHSPVDALAASVSAAGAAASNLLLEDTVNAILHEMVRQRMYSFGRPEPWLEVLQHFDSNTLADVYIDGAPAGWLAKAMLATIYADEHRTALATNWIERALATIHEVRNPVRMAELMLWVGNIHFTKELRNVERIQQFAEWARDVAPRSQRVQVEAESQLSGIARLAGRVEERAARLQALMDRHGCTLRPAMYLRLARDYFALGRIRQAVDVLCEAVKRSPIRLEPGFYNLFFETLYCARSVLTTEELERFRAMLRSSAMRFPAVMANVGASANALRLASAPWFDEHLALARMERAGAYGDEEWAAVCTAALQRASVRAGALHVVAQAARAAHGTNAFDWSGWLNGWQAVDNESSGPPTLGETGTRELLYARLLDVLEQYLDRTDARQRPAIVAAFENSICTPRNVPLWERAVRVAASWADTNAMVQLYVARARATPDMMPDDPVMRQLARMTNGLPPAAHLACDAVLSRTAPATPDKK